MPHICLSHATRDGACVCVCLMSCVTRVTHTWLNHATHMSESCHTHVCVTPHMIWVMPHTWISHATHMNESCHTHVWVEPRMIESYNVREWVMPYIWMSRTTHVLEWCHTHGYRRVGLRSTREEHEREARERSTRMKHKPHSYGVTIISRLLQNIGMFCRIVSFTRLFCKCEEQQWEAQEWSTQDIPMGWLSLVGSLKIYASFAAYSLIQRSFAKETYVFREPTNHSHLISLMHVL